MLRTIGMASLAVILLAACGEEGKESSFVSEAMATPATQGPDYGWRTDMAPNAVQDGTVKDYE